MFILDLVQERERERERGVECSRPSVGGGADELVPAGAIASMESRMEARKFASARRGSGDDGGRRRS